MLVRAKRVKEGYSLCGTQQEEGFSLGAWRLGTILYKDRHEVWLPFLMKWLSWSREQTLKENAQTVGRHIFLKIILRVQYNFLFTWAFPLMFWLDARFPLIFFSFLFWIPQAPVTLSSVSLSVYSRTQLQLQIHVNCSSFFPQRLCASQSRRAGFWYSIPHQTKTWTANAHKNSVSMFSPCFFFFS